MANWRKSVRAQLVPYSFLLPSFIVLIVFGFVPFVLGIWYSFTEYPLLKGPRFIGLDNYVRLARDPVFHKSLINTFYYVGATIPPRLVIGLALALILNRAIRGQTLFRAVFYFPVIAPMVTVAMLWRWLFNTHFGLINQAFQAIGLPSIPWLTSTQWAMPAIIIMSIWKVSGWNMVIFLAGLQGIPKDVYEAGAVDGTTAWTEFRHITLPLLRPTVLLALVLSTIAASQIFDQVYVMTGGGPGYATMTLVQQVYRAAFQTFEMGYGAAIAVVLLILILALTMVQFKYLGAEVEY